MSVKTYFLRAVKYLIYLSVFFTVIYFVMLSTGTTNISPEYFGEFINTSRGQLMIIFMSVICLLYPFFGFTKKDVHSVNTEKISTLIGFMEANGFKVEEQTEGYISFRAASVIKKLSLIYEDRIIVDYSKFPATMEGNRRAVARVMFRLDTFLLNN